MHIHCIVRTVYSSIFKDTYAYSATLTDTQLGEERGGFPFTFWKSKKGPDWVHLWDKFSIQNVVYKYLREKAPKFFPAGPLFLLLSKKSLLKCTSSTTHPPPLPKSCPEKFLAIPLHSNIILFAKSSTLMFDSVCSVICTVTLCYVLHQTHSEL